MELTLDLTTYAIATGLIFVIAVMFSMLGLGGGMLYVPVFKWLGMPLKTIAIPLGLLLNGITTLSAFLRYNREGLVDFRGGLPAAAAGLILAPVGAHLVQYVHRETLILLFAVTVTIAGLRTLVQSGKGEPKQMAGKGKRAIVGSLVGGAAGFIAGLLGVGGGFIVAPMLMELGYPTKQAAATTAFIVTFSSFSGFLAHMAEGHIDTLLAVLTVMAVIAGSQLGAWFMANKARPGWVKGFYGVLLLAVAIKLFLGLLGG
ncbi:MAG TPA: sulfite exporter TauE/SafE family protein [Acidiferrobacteraceae bacterium]|nr:sulfite exporter TauE/SafE family protein [Acidiferrobacteraceae bacterium]HEX20714.1 sulfite exporter TauE/SafE family protein [Acidiferrobacteraceae bacterium]